MRMYGETAGEMSRSKPSLEHAEARDAVPRLLRGALLAGAGWLCRGADSKPRLASLPRVVWAMLWGGQFTLGMGFVR